MLGRLVDVFFMGNGIDKEINHMKHSFGRTIDGRQQIAKAFGGERKKFVVNLTDYNGSWDPKEKKVLAVLFNGVTSIMKVDWLNSRFPQYVPNGFELMNYGDKQKLEDVINKKVLICHFFTSLVQEFLMHIFRMPLWAV